MKDWNKSWSDTHFEVVSEIAIQMSCKPEHYDPDLWNIVYEAHDHGGHKELYNLAETLTDEFEKLHKDTDWDENDYWIVIEKWLADKFKQGEE